jgi:hypothetical protein
VPEVPAVIKIDGRWYTAAHIDQELLDSLEDEEFDRVAEFVARNRETTESGLCRISVIPNSAFHQILWIDLDSLKKFTYSCMPDNFPRGSPNTNLLEIPVSFTLIPQFSSHEVISVETVTFEPPSQIRRIDGSAFRYFSSLTSICIPASVEFLARCCFISQRLSFLLDFTTHESAFERGSKLRDIEADAFSGCLSLREFCIPASVELLTGLSLPPSRLCIVDVERGIDISSGAGIL